MSSDSQFALFGLSGCDKQKLGLLAVGPWTLGTDMRLFERVDVSMSVFAEVELDNALLDSRRVVGDDDSGWL
jgi:hypothetical protein